MASSQSYKVPPAFTVLKSYNRWIEEIKVWQALTELEKKKQGLAIALSLPEEEQNSVIDRWFIWKFQQAKMPMRIQHIYIYMARTV